MNPVSIEYPENIEELLAAYLLEKAQQLRSSAPQSSDYVSLYIGVGAYKGNPLTVNAWASTELIEARGVPRTHGQCISEVTAQHLAAMEAYDPLAAKKAERAKLDEEIAALEGGEA